MATTSKPPAHAGEILTRRWVGVLGSSFGAEARRGEREAGERQWVSSAITISSKAAA